MEQQYINALLWFAGFLVCYWMLHAEHLAEGKEFTYGDKAVTVLLSLLSLLMVLFILVKAWAISVKPYWSQPVKDKKQKPE